MGIPTAGQYIYAKAQVLPSASLTDFYLLIDIAEWSTANKTAFFADVNTTDGTKGRITKTLSTTELASDWIDFDNTAKTGQIVTKYSGSLPTTGDVYVYVYAPNTRNASYVASATYGADNAYIAALKDYKPDGSTTDRTSNGNDGTRNGTVVDGTGKIGDSSDYGGASTDYARVADASSQDLGSALTYIVWIRPDSIADRFSIVQKYNTDSNRSYLIDSYDSDTIELLLSDDGIDIDANNWTSPLVADTWKMLAFTWASGEIPQLSVNGAAKVDGSGRAISGPLYASATPLDYGRSTYSTARALNGELNQSQLFNSNVSIAWIKEFYDMTNDNSTFWGTWTNGSLDTNIPISGATDSATSLSGSINIKRSISGTIDSVSALSGVINLTKSISGSTNSVSLLSGSVSIKGAIEISGSTNSVSLLSGSISVKRPISGSTGSVSLLSGSLSVERPFTGSTASITALSGNIIIKRGVSGSTDSKTALAGEIKLTKSIAGRTNTVTDLSGSINLTKALSGSTNSTSLLSGTISIKGEAAVGIVCVAITGSVSGVTLTGSTSGVTITGEGC